MRRGARKAVSDWPVAQFGHLKQKSTSGNKVKKNENFSVRPKEKGEELSLSEWRRGVERECGRSMTELSLPPPYTVTQTEPEGNQLLGTKNTTNHRRVPAQQPTS